jgi:hypothetical protein
MAVACSRAGVEVQRLPNGAKQLKCDAPLEQCLRYVDDVCKGGSYEVLYAKDERQLYGSEQSQVEGHRSQAEVHCLRSNADSLATSTPPPASAAPPSTSPAPAASSPPRVVKSERACVPGATQSCVGAGACAGGQACLPDGSGFAACDCGAAAPAPKP